MWTAPNGIGTRWSSAHNIDSQNSNKTLQYSNVIRQGLGKDKESSLRDQGREVAGLNGDFTPLHITILKSVFNEHSLKKKTK